MTRFFRDPDAFRILETEVIASLIQREGFGCSLARLGPRLCHRRRTLHHRDAVARTSGGGSGSPPPANLCYGIDEHALDIARRGVYPADISADVTPERLARFFTKVDDSVWQVSKQVRESVTFAVQNLIADAPFSKMDLISCRNVLIYLEPDVQKKVVALLHFALKEGGFLFLGPSETVGRQTDLFEPVSKKWRIYRRIGPTRSEQLVFPCAEGRGSRY